MAEWLNAGLTTIHTSLTGTMVGGWSVHQTRDESNSTEISRYLHNILSRISASAIHLAFLFLFFFSIIMTTQEKFDLLGKWEITLIQRPDSKHWRLGLDRKGEDDLVWVCEKPTIEECLDMTISRCKKTGLIK